MTTEAITPEMLHVWAISLRAGEEARRRGDRRAGTDHVLLALFADPSVEGVLGVSLLQARRALDSLDREALAALGLGPDADAPELPMHAVPEKPTLKYLMLQKDRLRITPAAKKLLEEASKPNRRRLYVTAQQMLAQILTLQPPDPAAALLGALGVDTSEVRRRLELPGQAGRETSGEGAVPFHGQARG
jgi:hypothetical protein